VDQKGEEEGDEYYDEEEDEEGYINEKLLYDEMI